MNEKKPVKVAPIDTHGLRVAKRLIADQVALMKGDRSEYARGYRAAMSDLRVRIDREIAAARPSLPSPAAQEDAQWLTSLT